MRKPIDVSKELPKGVDEIKQADAIELTREGVDTIKAASKAAWSSDFEDRLKKAGHWVVASNK